MLKIPPALIRAQNLRLHLLQLRCDKTFASHSRLLAGVIVRHVSQVRFRYFDEIAEDRIESYLERFDPGGSDFSLLQLGDPFFAGMRRTPQVIQIGIVTVPENSAFFQSQWWIVDD